MIPIASRLKDALWSVRRRFGLEADIDRLLPFIAFEQSLNEDQLAALFVTYPKRTPEDFKSALIIKIQQTVRQYWQYRQTRKGYHKVLKNVIFLENVARRGFGGCLLIPNPILGFRLELKPDQKKR